MSDQVASPQSDEQQVMRLYEQWPARRNSDGSGRPRAFFAWLQANHSHLTEYGVFGYGAPYQHISAITARWEGTYGRVERIGWTLATRQEQTRAR